LRAIHRHVDEVDKFFAGLDPAQRSIGIELQRLAH
jgi:hypothetical protein